MGFVMAALTGPPEEVERGCGRVSLGCCGDGCRRRGGKVTLRHWGSLSGWKLISHSQSQQQQQPQCVAASMRSSLSASLLNPEQALSSLITPMLPPSPSTRFLSNLIITISPLFSSVAPSHHSFLLLSCANHRPRQLFIMTAAFLPTVAEGK